MRSTKIMAFSVPEAMEEAIHHHAKAEHRTLSEYLREAVRHYMSLKAFETVQKSVSARLKKRGVKKSDVEAVLEELRK